MKSWIIALPLLLGACSAVTGQLDDATGTTLAQRCVDYQAFVLTAEIVQETEPTVKRARRLAFYRTFIAAYCEV